MSLSVVINTKNSAATLGLALKSVKGLADEVVVVDMMSTDNTKELAELQSAKVFDHPDVGYVEPARNYAINKAKGEWILILDSDEEVTGALKEVIQQAMVKGEGECFYIPRKNIVFNKWIEHTGWWPDYQLRLFKKGQVEWGNEIHSFPITKGKVVELPADEKIALIHHNYQTVEQFISRLNRYTSIQAQEKKEPKHLVRAFREEFLSRYFYNQGFRDGQHGLGLALLQAMYEVVVSLKVWQTQDFKASTSVDQTLAELTELKDELDYWIKTTYLWRASGLGKIWWLIRRKFKL